MDIDLTAIRTPFGLLDEATQEALKAHGGPYERFYCEKWEEYHHDLVGCDGDYVYRAKPQPVRKTVTAELQVEPSSGFIYWTPVVGTEPIRLSYDLVDGKPDWSTARIEARPDRAATNALGNIAHAMREED